MFKDASGTFILHVPYRGGGPAISDLLAGHVQLSFMTVLEASGHIKSGKLRALAVTSDKRVAAPARRADARRVGGAGLQLDQLDRPAGAGRHAGRHRREDSADVRDVIAADDVKSRLVELGGVPHTSTPAQFAQLIDTDRKRYAVIIRDRKITLD